MSTERLYLHVGGPKSGTTYLQGVLEANRGRLADAGVLVVGRNVSQRVHAALVVREDPRVAHLPAGAERAWQRLVDEIKGWSGRDAILSYELFSAASREQAERALADLDGIEVHVVITARDFARAVPSAWQERLKFATTTRLEKWRPVSEEDGPRAEWGWRTMDPANVAARWGAALPADHVHVVTVPRTGGQAELWRRFAGVCGIEVPGLDLDVARSNESMGVVAAELLRRVNRRVTDPIKGNREQARWIRDTLVRKVLAPLGGDPIGITDEQYADAVARSGHSIETIRGAGYDVSGDLDDLRATRPEGRLPGEVPEGELLGVATRVIFDLLVLLRAAGLARADHEVRPAGGRRRFARRALMASLAPVARHQESGLEEQIRELQEQLADSRNLQKRVAELGDVVANLLLPAGDAGEDLADALRRYRRQTLG